MEDPFAISKVKSFGNVLHNQEHCSKEKNESTNFIHEYTTHCF